MLPTPTTTQRGPDANLDTREGARANLHNVAVGMLPTPRASDGAKGGPNQRGSSGDLMLPSAVMHTRFGDYAPAIARHERLVGRPAPDPTEPAAKPLNRHGNPRVNPRLSPRFVEFMMCLPDGWVTDVPGVTRNEQLALLGNGVVPTQAVAALRHLASLP